VYVIYLVPIVEDLETFCRDDVQDSPPCDASGALADVAAVFLPVAVTRNAKQRLQDFDVRKIDCPPCSFCARPGIYLMVDWPGRQHRSRADWKEGSRGGFSPRIGAGFLNENPLPHPIVLPAAVFERHLRAGPGKATLARASLGEIDATTTLARRCNVANTVPRCSAISREGMSERGELERSQSHGRDNRTRARALAIGDWTRRQSENGDPFPRGWRTCSRASADGRYANAAAIIVPRGRFRADN